MTKQLTIKTITALGLFLLGALVVTSCKEEEPAPDPVASFQATISETNFLEVTFESFSQNGSTFAWEFGDGTSDTGEKVVKTYAAEGVYTVKLTVANVDGVEDTKSDDVTILDPDKELKKLTGETSKIWKVYREGVGLEVGPSEAQTGEWKSLKNDGDRPCVYDDTFTFHFDGTFEYNDGGTFWGEYGVWGTSTGENALFETCFEPTAENMTIDGVDVSAWGSGSHQFTYDAAEGTIDLIGTGAWMVIPNLGTTESHAISSFPPTKTIPVTITEEDGYDLMVVTFDHGVDGVDGGQGFRRATYVSYDDWNDEPALVEDFVCELDVLIPTELSHTFESATSFVELGAISGVSIITTGNDDPTDAEATKVGKIERTSAQFQEAIMKVGENGKDIDFTNMTTLSIEVYVPSSNDFGGTLSNSLEIGLADPSCVASWWTDLYQYKTENMATDQWVTLTYQLDAPTFASDGATNPKTRSTSLDMLYINFGGADHTATGSAFIRNLEIK